MLTQRGVLRALFFKVGSLPNMQRKRRVPFAIWVTLWAIIVIAALALCVAFCGIWRGTQH